MNVLVLGAGLIGASVAEELAIRGVGVTVLDMRSPGRGATQASAGLLAPYIEGREDSPLLDLCVRGLAYWDPFVERLRARTPLPFLYERRGTLEVAMSPDEAARLRDTRAWLTGLQVDSEWHDAAELARVEPSVSPDALGGLSVPSQGFVAAAALLRAVVQSARLGGAVFEESAEGARVDPHRDGVDVRVGARTIAADIVVVATGAWSGRVKNRRRPEPSSQADSRTVDRTAVDRPRPAHPTRVGRRLLHGAVGARFDCSSAPPSRTPDSTSAPRWTACAACSTASRACCRRPARHRSRAFASACVPPRPIACQSSDRCPGRPASSRQPGIIAMGSCWRR